MSKVNLPAAWALVNLGSIAHIEMGQSPESSSYNTVKEGLPFFQGKAEFQSMHPEIRKWCSAPLKTVGAGAILLSVRAPVGPTNLATEPSCIGRGLAGIEAKSEINQKYIFWYLRKMENWLAAQGTGSTFAAVSGQFVRDLEIPVAPAAEQTRIVEKLEELLTELDAGVAELKAAQKKLAQYRQSLLKAAVDGSLTAEWRDQNTPTETGAQLLTRILQERRALWEAKQRAKFEAQGKAPPKDWQKKYPEPVQPDTSDLPELPQGWVWASVNQLSEIQGGIQKQPSRLPVLNKYPFLRVANVARGKLNLDEVHQIELFPGELERLALIEGDVLIVEGNGSLTEIGRCAIWDGSISNAVHQNHLIRVRPIAMASQFVETWLNSLGGIDKLTKLAATTSGLYTLSVGKISKIPVPIAPLIEQGAAITELVKGLSALDAQVKWVSHSLKQSTAQRQNILRAAFSGQLVPQGPDDETASLLLARIHAEREPKAQAEKSCSSRGRKHA